jgi:hypothetical protein
VARKLLVTSTDLVEGLQIRSGARKEGDIMDTDIVGEFPSRLSTEEIISDSDIGYDYYKGYRRSHPINPETALYLAVLENGLEYYCRYLDDKSRRGQRLFREAEEWFFASDDDWYFSFENVCAVLSINPGYVRRGLRRYARNHANPGPDSRSKKQRMEKAAA